MPTTSVYIACGYKCVGVWISWCRRKRTPIPSVREEMNRRHGCESCSQFVACLYSSAYAFRCSPVTRVDTRSIHRRFRCSRLGLCMRLLLIPLLIALVTIFAALMLAVPPFPA